MQNVWVKTSHTETSSAETRDTAEVLLEALFTDASARSEETGQRLAN